MKMIDQKISDISIVGIVRLIRELAFIFVVSYLLIRLFSGKMSLDFGKLSSSELVSFLLAFFSIGLSAAFYFAATNQSNQFYDNVNKFTKDTSELLGRLDEQVKGIGGRQSELKESLDKYYLKDRNKPNDDEKRVVEAQAKIVEESLSEMVKKLLDKSSLTQTERHQFETELKKKDAELGNLREQMGRFTGEREARVRRHSKIQIKRLGIEKVINTPRDQLALEIIKTGIPAYKRDLLSLGFISTIEPTSSDQITKDGMKMLDDIFVEYLEKNRDSEI